MELDPRRVAVRKMLGRVKRVVSVVSTKGGVGKSMISVTFALILSRRGYRVGLLDLDLHNPSAHVILGECGAPSEDRGILPPEVHGLKFVSIVHFSDGRPVFLRGGEISDTIVELLSVSQWGSLDFLIVDMPPGSGDELLETIKLLQGLEVLAVSTPSKLAREAVEKMVAMLEEMGVRVVGVVENMVPPGSLGERDERVLGKIRFDGRVEEAIGKVEELLSTDFAMDVERVVEAYLRASNIRRGVK